VLAACTSLAKRVLLPGLILVSAIPAASAEFVAGTKVSRAGDLAVVSLSFNCNLTYLDHEPLTRGDQLRIHVEPTSICRGVPPGAAITREQHRPTAADEGNVVDIEYDGTSPTGAFIRISFSEDVGFAVEPFANASTVLVRVRLNDTGSQRDSAAPPPRASQRVDHAGGTDAQYVINLQSSDRPPATADLPQVIATGGQVVYVATAEIDGRIWYRTRLGYFASAELAARELARLRKDFPGAWIDQQSPAKATETASVTEAEPVPLPLSDADVSNTTIDGEVSDLMRDAKRAMTAGELSTAIQIYTKVLQQPGSTYHPQAQEYLALARERNGQIAHARAEYQRFLASYPDDEGVPRVKQRLAALLAQPSTTAGPATTAPGMSSSATLRAARSPWTVRTFLTQYYRRDVNQVNDNDEVVSQSALFSDVNLDARRRGERYDFSARVSGGYRYDFLGETDGSGNRLRLSYAYADVADSRFGLRGRLGRQSRNSGGVLGRFDGANLGYQLNDRLRFEAVAGKPVNSTADGLDDERTFYGVSSTFGLLAEDLETGVFLLQQDVNGMTDRQAIGAELRYFGENKTLWAMGSYDTSFDELGSLFVQGSWRIAAQTTVTGVIDRRRSPFLSASNALIGQSIEAFSELQAQFSEEEIRELALDRAATSSTITLGLSRPLTPKLQANINISDTEIDATPDSGGVSGMPASSYRYVSTDLVASSLITEGDVSVFGLRYADSQNNSTYSASLDSRFPIGGRLRINPRLRLDYREIKSDDSTQWTYSPGLRLQYRKDRGFRIDLEVGMQFSNREMDVLNQERESWFVNAGYQWFF
jgi:tetratricopeptide (TPR) repeat protein